MTKQMDQAIMDLYYQLSLMSGFVERAMNDVIKGFDTKNMELLQSVVDKDVHINEKEREIEQICTIILSRYTPVARDVREITGIFKIITDLERIGDQCSDVAELMIEIGYDEYMEPAKHFPAMLELAKKMLKDSIDSYVLRDLKMASSMYRRDDAIDELLVVVEEELVDVLKDPNANIAQCLSILLIAKYIERIGDHCTNICEWITYNITGEREDIDSYNPHHL